ncbi:SRPBCC domain-containing protein [Larkinella bovis]|uniref:SRPBCC domain-containing protein n=1 Tax=Larkinella bovis TaxID=683041 RepID=A0ABW0IDU2_9BACT
MERRTFKTTIDAPRETVWNILWGDTTYPQWTAVFSEGSRAETDWQEGSKVLFLNEKGEGMVSRIETSIPNEYMSFKHLGEVNHGAEDLYSDRVREWAGSMENYTLKTVDGKTELTVEIDIVDDHIDYFEKTWPPALEKLKELAEG